MPHDSNSHLHFFRSAIPALIFFGVFLLVAATSKDYGIAWDEPAYFHASDLHVAWIVDLGENIIQRNAKASLADESIKAAWHWDPYHVPHPPFSRIVSGLTRTLSDGWLDKFSGYRLGAALFFAILATVMFLWMNELFDVATGMFSAVALIVTPNLFGFAHIAVTDLPLASMWFLTVYCFWKGVNDWRWSVACGLAWGLAMATKFPALLIPIPLIFWAQMFYPTRHGNNVFALLSLGPLMMIASQPYLWHQTTLRILEFLYEGLSRGYRTDTNFAVFFFNRFYYTDHLPWYYPFFMIGVTTPEPVLLLAVIGMFSIFWRRVRRPAIVLFALNAVFLIALGLLPGAVLHDGVRQLLSGLPFIVALAGVGFYTIARSLRSIGDGEPFRTIKNGAAKITGTLILVLLFPPVLELYLLHPFELSFYNRLVGGVRGAYERGLEATYSMEAFTPTFLAALNGTLPHNAVLNASFANFMFLYYQKEGRLRADIKFTDTWPFNYYVLLNRRSVLQPRDRLLFSHFEQAYLSVNLAGVPLVGVFAGKKAGP
jgi:Dolichyl-phosphate-mannose-protein mannosyltransferase